MAENDFNKEQDAQPSAESPESANNAQPETQQSSDDDQLNQTGDAAVDEDVVSDESAIDEAIDEIDHAAQSIQSEAEQMDIPDIPETAGGAKGFESGDGMPMDLPDFNHPVKTNGEISEAMELLSDVSMDVTIELGRTRMYIEDVLRLNANSIVELDKAAGDPVDIYVNDCHVARGEVLVLNENFCVRVSEIISTTTTTQKSKE